MKIISENNKDKSILVITQNIFFQFNEVVLIKKYYLIIQKKMVIY